jgi:hypothetical protein
MTSNGQERSTGELPTRLWGEVRDLVSGPGRHLVESRALDAPAQRLPDPGRKVFRGEGVIREALLRISPDELLERAGVNRKCLDARHLDLAGRVLGRGRKGAESIGEAEEQLQLVEQVRTELA